MEQKHKRQIFVSAFLGTVVSLGLFVSTGLQVFGQEGHELVGNPDLVADLNREIEAKRKSIEELRQQAEAYQASVDNSAQQVQSIATQISSIDAQISLTNNQIQSKQAEIEKLQLEMDVIEVSIDEKNAEIADQRGQLGEMVKQLDRSTRTPLLTILLTNDHFSDFFDQAQAYATLSDNLQTSVGAIQRLRDELDAKHSSLAKAKDEIDQAKLQLEIGRQTDFEQRQFQQVLLADAERSKDQYDLLLQQSLQAEQQAGATITSLERQLQNSLGGGEPAYTSTGYIWPLRGTITAYYRDPSYPFRCAYFKSPSCLEHTGIDIGTPQGTPVRATADGTVAAFTSYNTTQLNYVSLFHGSGITSRYLHLNRVLVGAEQFVKQGDIIGYSGGMPGTAGSGGLTTGPHLHFEIRVDGLPDDPLRYLQ